MNAAIPLLASAFLFLALSSTPVTAWLDCTPGCNSGYSIQSTDCSSNPSTCISTCHRPLSCGDWIDEIDGYDEDSDYNDNTVELDFNIDPQAFEDKGRCHAKECYTDYCYELYIEAKARAYLEENPDDRAYMDLYCESKEDIIAWHNEELIDDSDRIDLDGSDTARSEGLYTIYPLGAVPRSSLQQNEGVLDEDNSDDRVDCEYSTDDVDEVWGRVFWEMEMHKFLPEDSYPSSCDKINEAPVLDGIPDYDTDEDTAPATNIADLYTYHTDPDGSDEDSAFFIQAQSNTALISCHIADDRYVHCSSPVPNGNGYSDITVRADDAYGNSDTDTFRMNVHAVNDLPSFSVATSDDSSEKTQTPDDGTVTFTATISDIDGDDVRLVICDMQGFSGDCLGRHYCSDPPSGTELQGDKLCTFAVTPLEAPANPWQSYACDAAGSCVAGSTGTFYVDLPIISDVTVLLGETEVLAEEGMFLGETTLTLTAAINDFLADCAPDASGYCLIPLAVEATGKGTLLVDSVDISYAVTNAPPRLDIPTDIVVTETDAISFTPSATDPDDYALSYTVSPPLDSGIWETDYSSAGTYPITVAVSDGEHTDTADFTLTVQNRNRAPVLAGTDSDIEIDEGRSVQLEADATEPDGDAMLYQWELDGIAVGTTAAYTYTADYDDAGDHTLLAIASDAELSSSLTYTLHVSNINRAPTLVSLDPGDVAMYENEMQPFSALAYDADGDTLSYSWLLDGTNVGNETTYTYFADYSTAGEHTLSLTISDGNLERETSVIIDVTNANRAPVITSFTPENTTVALDEGELQEFSISAADPDGDPIFYDWLLDGNSVSDTDSYTLSPGFDAAGQHFLTVVLSDRDMEERLAWRITVHNVNLAPIITRAKPPEGEQFVDEGTSLAFLVSASDPDGGELQYRWWMDGELVSLTAYYTYTPDYDDAGEHGLIIAVSDGFLSADKSYLLHVTNVNRAPLIDRVTPADNPFHAKEGTSTTFSVVAADPDGDPLFYDWLLDGNSVSNTDSYTYSPGAHDSGEHTLSITVDDGMDSAIHTTHIAVADTLACKEPELRPCFSQQGVCAGHSQQCIAGSWSNCGAPDYQPAESLCDGMDNDCDGLVDEWCVTPSWRAINGEWDSADGLSSPTAYGYGGHALVVDDAQSLQDFEVTVQVSIPDIPAETGLCGRLSTNGNGYCLSYGWGGTQQIGLSLFTGPPFNPVLLTAGPHLRTTAKDFYLKLHLAGSTMQGKVWAASGTEPGWQVETSDARFSDGSVGYYTYYTPAVFTTYTLTSPANTPPVLCADTDGDAFSDALCSGTDCNDYDSAIHPGAEEQCNGIDDNCNGQIDDGCPPEEWAGVNGDWHAADGSVWPTSYGYGGHPLVVAPALAVTDGTLNASVIIRSGRQAGLCGRMSAAGEGYCAAYASGTVSLYRYDGFPYNPSLIGRSAATSIPPDARFHLKLALMGNQLQGKAWAAGTPEPNWQVSASDTHWSSGTAGYSAYYTTAAFSDLALALS